MSLYTFPSVFAAGNHALWNGNMWVAAGSIVGSTTHSLAYSYNGTAWTGLDPTFLARVDTILPTMRVVPIPLLFRGI